MDVCHLGLPDSKSKNPWKSKGRDRSLCVPLTASVWLTMLHLRTLPLKEAPKALEDFPSGCRPVQGAQ